MANEFTIYRDVPVGIVIKDRHIHRIGGRLCGCIHRDIGDLPLTTLNRLTDKMMPVQNLRGFAYARRRDIRYRPNPKSVVEKEI